MQEDKEQSIHNPILRGFHPDPSVIRVGEDYYIATSTFEWWPGVRLHHSRDLVHWELIGYPLNRISQLDLRGVGASQGIWAPCLTYDDGTYYLVYTIVRSFYCNMYDTENFLVKTKDIRGPWSEPVPLNNFGFDPSLFHDRDGRKYMVSMVTDHRVPKKYAGRIVLQEYDARRECMVGPVREIYTGEHIFLEGPHIFRRGDWYYLFCADTGTGELHGQTVLRAGSVFGPYEMYRPRPDPRWQEGEAYSVLTSRHHPELPLQKAGHCDLVETQDGEWYAVYLCARPSGERNPKDAPRFAGSRRYMIGRETAIRKISWTEDGWPVTADGSGLPREYEELPSFLEKQDIRERWESGRNAGWEQSGESLVRDDFDAPLLNLDYQSLRIPMDERYLSLSVRPGWLRMYGRSGLSSKFSQTLIARRMTEYRMTAETCLEFEPEVFKQMAGLILLYDTDNYLYLHISHDEDVGKCVTLLKAENKSYTYLTGYIPVEAGRALVLGLELEGTMVQFRCGYRGQEIRSFGPAVSAGFLSDEACLEGWFTGTMVGICCQDLTGFGAPADFDYFQVAKKEMEKLL